MKSRGSLRLKRHEQPLPLQPADLLPSDEFIPLNLEWESLDDQPLLEK